VPSNIKWSDRKILETLACKVAKAAMQGKPSPVAALVIERLEAKGV
jgi:hypothetical protein